MVDLLVEQDNIPAFAVWNDLLINKDKMILFSKNSNRIGRKTKNKEWDQWIIPETFYKKACILDENFVLFTGKEICISDNGTMWKKYILPDRYVEWKDIVFFGEYYIIVSEYNIQYSKNLTEWTSCKLPEGAWDYKLYSNDSSLYIVSYRKGIVHTTKNLLDFTTATFSNEFDHKKSFCNNHGIFILSTYNQVIFFESIEMETTKNKKKLFVSNIKDTVKVTFETPGQNLLPIDKSLINNNFDWEVQDFIWTGKEYVLFTKNGEIITSIDFKTWNLHKFTSSIVFNNTINYEKESMVIVDFQLLEIMKITLSE